MRMGRVVIRIEVGYAVDLDNPNMVREAKDWAYEDVTDIIESGDIYDMVKMEEAPSLTEHDIHSGLLEYAEAMNG